MRLIKMEAGDAVTVSIRTEINLKMKPGAGATIRYSEVDDSDASAHGAVFTDIIAETTVTPSWPHYRISVSGGSATIGLV